MISAVPSGCSEAMLKNCSPLQIWPSQTVAGNTAYSPKLLDRVRATLRTNRYSPRTEKVYVEWIKRFIRFHGVRHPQEMGVEEVKAFLSLFVTQMNVAASTQNQAFSALLFLYQEVLKQRAEAKIASLMTDDTKQ